MTGRALLQGPKGRILLGFALGLFLFVASLVVGLNSDWASKVLLRGLGVRHFEDIRAGIFRLVCASQIAAHLGIAVLWKISSRLKSTAAHAPKA